MGTETQAPVGVLDKGVQESFWVALGRRRQSRLVWGREYGFAGRKGECFDSKPFVDRTHQHVHMLRKHRSKLASRGRGG